MLHYPERLNTTSCASHEPMARETRLDELNWWKRLGFTPQTLKITLRYSTSTSQTRLSPDRLRMKACTYYNVQYRHITLAPRPWDRLSGRELIRIDRPLLANGLSQFDGTSFFADHGSHREVPPQGGPLRSPAIVRHGLLYLL